MICSWWLIPALVLLWAMQFLRYRHHPLPFPLQPPSPTCGPFPAMAFSPASTRLNTIFNWEPDPERSHLGHLLTSSDSTHKRTACMQVLYQHVIAAPFCGLLSVLRSVKKPLPEPHSSFQADMTPYVTSVLIPRENGGLLHRWTPSLWIPYA